MAIICDIENAFLKLLYKRDFDNDFNLKISYTDIPLNENDAQLRVKEMGYYILRLDSLGYLEIGTKPPAYIKGGNDDNKYRNNICGIWFEYIHLSYKGRKFVEEGRVTRRDKIILSIKRFFLDVINELRNRMVSNIVSFIIGLVAMYIYLKYVKN